MEIFTQKMSDYKIVDIILKVWALGLIGLVVIGMGGLLFHIITNPNVLDNATFGIFDTLG